MRNSKGALLEIFQNLLIENRPIFKNHGKNGEIVCEIKVELFNQQFVVEGEPAHKRKTAEANTSEMMLQQLYPFVSTKFDTELKLLLKKADGKEDNLTEDERARLRFISKNAFLFRRRARKYARKLY